MFYKRCLAALAARLQFSLLVLGSDADSTRAELAAIYAACKLLLEMLLAAAFDPATMMVNIYTDCQSVADAVQNEGNLQARFQDDVTGEAVTLPNSRCVSCPTDA